MPHHRPFRRPPRRTTPVWLFAALTLAAGASWGAPDAERVARWSEALGETSAADGVLSQPPAALTMEDAVAVRAGYVARLLGRRGPVVGYKAALTSAQSQQRFGLNAPVYGFLLRDMLLASASRLRRPQGALAPMIEADLVVRVGNAAINDAVSAREVLAGLDAVLPFIELPALPFAGAADAPAFVAANAGAWRGVLGAPLALRGDQDWAQRLREVRVRLEGGDGAVLGTGVGANLLGDPLAVVIWLRDALRADGRRLERGDLLSLGSLTAPQAVPWGSEVIATYENLGPEPVTVRLRCE